MKTKHILLLGLGSLTATAAIATPIALVNSDLKGNNQTKIIVGTSESDSVTLEVPFSEKINSTKAFLTLVHEGQEEQRDADIIAEDKLVKVVLKNLKPNTKYQIKQIKLDDKVINLENQNFSTKDNTLNKGVIIKTEVDDSKKTAETTNENKESKNAENNEKQEKTNKQTNNTIISDNKEQNKTPNVELSQQGEKNAEDNSANKPEEPKDQSNISGPSFSNYEENKVKSDSQDAKKSEEKNGVELSNTEPSPVLPKEPQKIEQSPSDKENEQIQISGDGTSNSDEQQSKTSKAIEPTTVDSNPSNTSQSQNTIQTETQPDTSAPTSQDNVSSSTQVSNPDQAITSNQEAQVEPNQQTDNSVTIKVGYWRVYQYSTKKKQQKRTESIAKVIKDLQLNLIAISGISPGKDNNGQKIVDELNKGETTNTWSQITNDSKSKTQKSKIAFIYNTNFLKINPETEKIKTSNIDDSKYILKPVSLKFETNNHKTFSLVSSIFLPSKSKSSNDVEFETTRLEQKVKTKNKDQQVEELENLISELTETEKNVIFIGDTNVFSESSEENLPLNNFESWFKEPTLIDTNKSIYTKKDVTIFTKKNADFIVENPKRFDFIKFLKDNNLTDKQTKQAPVYIDLKFN